MQREVEEQRRRRDARRLLEAEDLPPLRVLGFGDFLTSPGPEPLVPNLLYRDSLSRLFGPPGCGKSFVALDLALRVALGWSWTRLPVVAGPVVYVMAEGQRVNTDRARAWLDRNAVAEQDLEGRFFAVPDAVMLTPTSVEPFVAFVEEIGAALVVLDTKNAMMVGDESSARDFAELRAAMDLIRKASGACVLLVDHTGYEGERARGSSAGTAAMDTELRMSMPERGRFTLTVTRDKASEDGFTRDFELEAAPPAAVVVPAVPGGGGGPQSDRAWRDASGVEIPDDVTAYKGTGAAAVPDLARLMAHDAAPDQADPGRVGLSRAEAARALKAAPGHSEPTVRRAWSVLLDLHHIVPAAEGIGETGRHVWTR
jgi:hypothetical protein